MITLDEDDWADRAACKGKPLSWFFGGPGKNQDLDKGKRCCLDCPVLLDCRKEAESYVEHPSWGVWGGQLYRDGVVCHD